MKQSLIFKSLDYLEKCGMYSKHHNIVQMNAGKSRPKKREEFSLKAITFGGGEGEAMR